MLEAVRVIVIGDGADSGFGNGTLKRVFDPGTPMPLERRVKSRVVLRMLWRLATGIGGCLADGMSTRRNSVYPVDDPSHMICYPYTHPLVWSAGKPIPREVKLPRTKFQLRQGARLMGVPEFILTRPKAYFGVESERWAGRGGPLGPLVRLAAAAVGEDTMRWVQVPDEKFSRIYWNLLNSGIWRWIFIEGDDPQSLIDGLQAS